MDLLATLIDLRDRAQLLAHDLIEAKLTVEGHKVQMLVCVIQDEYIDKLEVPSENA